MRDKLNLQLLILLLVFSIILLNISARGCQKRNKTKAGSSNNAFMINAPSNLIATAVSSSGINLSWIDNSNNEDGFEIERSTNGMTFSLLTSVNSNIVFYSNIGLLPSTNYYYRIRAYNIIGDRSNYSNQVDAITSELVWISIAGGIGHTIALTSDRTIWGTGQNDSFQLGIGDTYNRITLTPINNETDWLSIAVGAYHSIGLKTNRTLWGWGLNGAGQLGLGSTDYDGEIPYSVGTDSDWSLVTAGVGHTIGLKTNGSAQPPGGTMWAWGNNDNGQLGLGDIEFQITQVIPIQVGTNADWSAVESWNNHSVAITTNGTVWSWGSNSEGVLGLGVDDLYRTTPSQIGTETDWVSVAVGTDYSIARKANSSIWGWGSNGSGQLGFGDNDSRPTPTQIGSETDWYLLAIGSEHSTAIKMNNTIWSWGINNNGQLGLDDLYNRKTPTQIGTDSDWSAIDAGVSYTVAIKTNNVIWVWGQNNLSQLGLGDTMIRKIPTRVITTMAPNPPASLIATLISSSRVDLSWRDLSYNESGFRIERKINRNGIWVEIGDVYTNITVYSDITDFVPATTYYYRVRAYNSFGNSIYSNEDWNALSGNWIAFGAGFWHTMAIKNNGTVWSWGDNDFGQLGLGNSGSNTKRNTPTQIGIDSDWSVVVGGGNGGGKHTIMLKTNKTIWTCGYNGHGQLGLDDLYHRNTPSQIGTDSEWLQIAAGGFHSIGVKSNGSIWTWGYNGFGQLGLGDPAIVGYLRTTPSQVDGNTDWSTIEGGDFYTITLKNNSCIWAWGYNGSGQLGDGTTETRNTPRQIGADSDWSIAKAGRAHALARKTNGTILSWGNNENGQLGLGDSGTGINRNTPTQIGTNADWSLVATGFNHSIARKIDGTIWSWGDNSYNQLGLGYTVIVPTRTFPTKIGIGTDWTIIGAGGDHTLAYNTNGTIWVWGYNGAGQLGLGDTINRNIPTLVGE